MRRRMRTRSVSRRHEWRMLAGFALVAFLVGAPAWAGDYYVSPTGDDANPGTIDQPWATITKAAFTLVAGDTVYIRAGTYNERVVAQNSGAPGAYITYASYPGVQAIIDGTGVSVPRGEGLFYGQFRSYIRVSSLRVQNSQMAGILFEDSDHLEILDNHTYNTVESGIGVWNSNNTLIEGNEVELACNDGEQECISVAVTDTFDVRYNHIHHSGPGTIGGEGICLKDGSTNGRIYRNYVHHINRIGIYLDAWNKHTYDMDVYQNLVHDCVGNGYAVVSENGGLLERVNIYNNVAYANTENGLLFGHYGNPVPVHPLANINVVNNTFYGNGATIPGSGDWGGGIYVESRNIQSVTIRNNICSQNLTWQIAMDPRVPASEFTIDHNLIDGFRGFAEELRGTDYQEGDPLFVSTTAPDFHIQAGSPAIDNGSSAGAPPSDYDGWPRPNGAGIDIGAHEYYATTPTPLPTPTSSPSATPSQTPFQVDAYYDVFYGGDGQRDTSDPQAVVIVGGGLSDTLSIFPKRDIAGERPPIPLVRTDGSFRKMRTLGDIVRLEVAGQLRSLTAVECYVGVIDAGEVGTVRMAPRPAGFTESGGPFGLARVSIAARSSAPFSPNGRFLKPKIMTSGVFLENLSVSDQLAAATVKVMSKKYRRENGSQYVSYGAVSDGEIDAYEIKRISTKGGPVTPGSVRAEGVASIATKGMVFRLRNAGGAPFYVALDGDIEADEIVSGSIGRKLSVVAKGGDIVVGTADGGTTGVAPGGILAGGSIAKVMAKMMKLRSAEGGYADGGIVGFAPTTGTAQTPGYVPDGGPWMLIESGAADLRAPDASNYDIRVIHGDLAVLGVFVAGDEGTVEAPNPTGSIRRVSTRGSAPGWVVGSQPSWWFSVQGYGVSQEEIRVNTPDDSGFVDVLH